MYAPIEFCAAWRKSSFSGPKECVEVAFADAVVGLRDSKNDSGPVLAVTRASWTRFLDTVR
jgi:uncharacterized protein DUF397